MATAVQPSAPSRQPSERARLASASLFGALFVIAGVAVAAYAVPQVWDRFVAPALPLAGYVADGLRLLAQALAVAAFVWVGSHLTGSNPPQGVRGGIFLALVAIAATALVTRAVGVAFDGSALGAIITAAVLAAMTYGTYWLISARQPWMVALEEQGWFHTFSYKRTQGLRSRRYTLMGFLLIGWSGVYSLFEYRAVGTGPWVLAIPFTGDPPVRVTVLPDVEYTVPILLAIAAFWISWRAVNMPAFADFLIATEAEMNKVSWPTRKGLVQDTIVVLATTIILTLFLLVVDWFWGTALSGVGVLPDTSVQPGDSHVITVDW